MDAQLGEAWPGLEEEHVRVLVHIDHDDAVDSLHTPVALILQASMRTDMRMCVYVCVMKHRTERESEGRNRPKRERG